VPSAEVVEVDDLFYGARVAGGGRSRGTAKQPLIAAVDRAPAGTGSCVVRVVEDCTAASYRQFGHDHLCRASTIRTDPFCGSSAGLSSFGGLDQRDYDGGDPDASLPMVHRVISNFRAMASGTFHGLAGGRPPAALRRRVLLALLAQVLRRPDGGPTLRPLRDPRAAGGDRGDSDRPAEDGQVAHGEEMIRTMP
jgi:hypothetical protein